MRNIYTLLFTLLLSAAVTAQVNVTYQVDITEYLASEVAPLSENGIRIGGNFADFSADGPNGPVQSWSPSDASAAMTDLGNNIWSITVTYPLASVGGEQLYKFVNGDWGVPGVGNEGGDMSSIATDGCGVDDGSGNINRTLIIPATDMTLTFCWERCSATCATGIDELSNIRELSISPNPMEDVVTFRFDMDRSADVTLTLLNILGEEVRSEISPSMAAGEHVIEMDIEELNTGAYFYRLQSGSNVTAGKLIKK
jgi:hypothetical protein